MDKPEPLLLISSWNSIAIPVSKAKEVLQHLLLINEKYEDGKKSYELKTDPLSLTFMPVEQVITMLVTDKLTNKE